MNYLYGYLGSRLLLLGLVRKSDPRSWEMIAADASGDGYTQCFVSNVSHPFAGMISRA